MPVSKQTRRNRHESAETPTLKRGNPSSSEGRVGTQQFRNIAGILRSNYSHKLLC